MKTTTIKISIRDLTKNFVDTQEEGVFGYDNKLNIRPSYQREFVYDEKKRSAVIKTIDDLSGEAIGIFQWGLNANGTYEVIDGQQRTISICYFVKGVYGIDDNYFHSWTKENQEKFLDKELLINVFEGSEKEKLRWFKTINIAGEKLTNQELRNAVYTGEWLTKAKKLFSKTGCPAHSLSEKYINGSPIRQEILEIALSWIADSNGTTIENYMSKHQHDTDVDELWNYFEDVFTWIKRTFISYNKLMNGIDWGILYNKYHKTKYSPADLDKKISELLLDEEITKPKGIWEYVLGGEEKLLHTRTFDTKQKALGYARQNGLCIKCNGHFLQTEMEADHITPWSNGGKTDLSNLQMLCLKCNRTKSDK